MSFQTDPHPVVSLPYGKIKGITHDILSFYNIPYASAKRFEKPSAPASWNDIRSAEHYGPICPQYNSRLEEMMGKQEVYEMSEECLLLSVNTPKLEGKLPVMVWIHGGSFITGSGEQFRYDTAQCTAEGGVVTVNISYRLGAFGFLYWPEKGIENLGLLDQIAGLKWVRDHISLFGGDPDNITLFGQSAGAYSIAAHITSCNERLFHKAILQSTPLINGIKIKDAVAVRRAFLSQLNSDPFTATTEELLEAQKRTLANSSKGMTFCPVVQNILSTQPKLPYQLLMGWGKHDASPFIEMMNMKRNKSFGSRWDRILSIFGTQLYFIIPTLRFARKCKKSGSKITFYQINWIPENSRYGACHCIELPLLVADAEYWLNAPIIGSTSLSELKNKGRAMRWIWTNFAKSTPPQSTDWLNFF